MDKRGQRSQMAQVYLGLGSNLGNRAANLSDAMAQLSKRIEVKRVSSVYETEPVGYLDQPLFLNAAIEAVTDLSPGELLSLAMEVEGALGRRREVPKGPRSIDVDILLYGDLVIEKPGLTVPHPRMAERAFVLLPLAEIAPGAMHPVLEATIVELAERVEGKEGVRLASSPSSLREVKESTGNV